MFTIEMLPAGYGDCLWIEYGDAATPKRVLIDGGISGTYDALHARLRQAGPECTFELLVITHVDGDHIDGIVKLLANMPQDVTVTLKDIWFNGWKHLPQPGDARLGGPQGEMLSALLERERRPWNSAFGGGAVAITDGTLPEVLLDGGLKLTLLSPTLEQLRQLRPVWEEQCRRAGLIPGDARDGYAELLDTPRLRPREERLGDSGPDVPALGAAAFVCDAAEANGSSIALLAEYDGRALLLCADAFPTVLETSVDRLLRQRGATRLPLAACKVSHHGSKGNTSPALLRKLETSRYLISTNGSKFYHPHGEAIARILLASRGTKTLYFNYRSDENKPWDHAASQRQHSYRTVYPAGDKSGLKVDLL